MVEVRFLSVVSLLSPIWLTSLSMSIILGKYSPLWWISLCMVGSEAIHYIYHDIPKYPIIQQGIHILCRPVWSRYLLDEFYWVLGVFYRWQHQWLYMDRVQLYMVFYCFTHAPMSFCRAFASCSIFLQWIERGYQVVYYVKPNKFRVFTSLSVGKCIGRMYLVLVS